MLCPRCCSNADSARFCWMCGWDMDSFYMDCDKCGSDVGDDGYCLVCGALVFIDDDETEP